jgi:sensor histidine kinase regulating citrate/malate metabolism
MVEALHGRIWVESEGANMGSTFFIEVPKEMREE